MIRRRLAVILSIILIILISTLGGCALQEQSREADQLLVVQAMGLDAAPEGVRLSLASAGGAAGQPPLRLAGSAPSVTGALEQIRAGANDKDLFCAHLSHLLIGEEAARQGIGPCLDYVCRSGDLRLSVPLYILRGAEAQEAVLGTGDDSFGICGALDALQAELRRRGDGRETSAANILRDLARRGCALVCALKLQPSAESDRSAGAEGQPLSPVPDGYAVLKNGLLCGFLDRETAVGVGLLLGQSGLCELTVTDQAGLPVTLTLTGGRGSVETDGGESPVLAVRVEAVALVSESAAGDTDLSYLQMMLERTLADRVREALRLSRQWNADFLGLEDRFSLLSLPTTVSVSARLGGVGDLELRP